MSRKNSHANATDGIWATKSASFSMRTQKPADIQQVHDLLNAILLGRTPVTITDKDQEVVAAVLDALCWVLRHPDTKFENNLKAIFAKLDEHNYPLPPRPPQAN